MPIDTNYGNIETSKGSGTKQTDALRTSMGFRETSYMRSGSDKEYEENKVPIKDVGDARTLGPVKAAYIISPTREAKNFRWTTRKV